MKKRSLIIVFIVVVLIASALALADALGVYNHKGYTEVSHGSHIHYVPTNRDPDIGISRFPMQEPGPDEFITPTGQIVKKTDRNDQ